MTGLEAAAFSALLLTASLCLLFTDLAKGGAAVREPFSVSPVSAWSIEESGGLCACDRNRHLGIRD